jgi:hypothetical protein
MPKAWWRWAVIAMLSLSGGLAARADDPPTARPKAAPKPEPPGGKRRPVARPQLPPKAPRAPVRPGAPARPTPPLRSPAPAVQRPQIPHTDAHRPDRAPPYQTRDHRWARPRVPAHDIDVDHPRPANRHYWGRYSHWWVHPYYRWHHATVVVVPFGWVATPWVDTWTPPPRPGWVWIPGHWAGPHWVPGQFSPLGSPPVFGGVRFTYVPGWWLGPVYVEGYWRATDRAGWQWLSGYYRDDGSYVWGYWAPLTPGPRGFVWERGYWDGDRWVEGFWRRESRAGYRWVAAAYGEDGIFRAGYWEPLTAQPGWVWVPGWFDGARWVPGYWVSEADYRSVDPERWAPPSGWDAGEPPNGAEPADDIAVPVSR